MKIYGSRIDATAIFKVNPHSRVSLRDLAQQNMKIYGSRIDATAIFKVNIHN